MKELFAVIAFFSIMGGIGALIAVSIHVKGLRDECEATLPRDQHCKLIAVPDAPLQEQGKGEP